MKATFTVLVAAVSRTSKSVFAGSLRCTSFPLIPLDLLGEYVECGGCGDTYRPEVLQLDPGAGSEEFEAEFQTAVKRTMVLMALADGVVDPEEVTTICDIYGNLADRTIGPVVVQAEIEQGAQRWAWGGRIPRQRRWLTQ